jgi:uncharacterized protein YbjT (DUF2867 family)
MVAVLVTGGTGTLGRPTVAALVAAGHDVRVLSRRPGPRVVVGDLDTGQGLTEALQGRSVIVHLATTARTDQATAALARAAAATGVQHLVLMSIVGVDRIPLRYYRGKLESERLVAQAGVPHTVLRATQFHDLVAGMFAAQRWSPLLVAPTFRFQPIDVRDVATRLTELCGGPPMGRAADIGGPEILAGPSLGRQWARAVGSRRPVVPLRLPGRLFAAYRAGFNLVPGPPFGRRTFAHYLETA